MESLNQKAAKTRSMAFVADFWGEADSPDLVTAYTLFQHCVNAESSFLMLMACSAHSPKHFMYTAAAVHCSPCNLEASLFTPIDA